MPINYPVGNYPDHNHWHPLACHHCFIPPCHHQRSQISGRVREVLRLNRRQKYMDFSLRYPRSHLQKRGSYPMTSMAYGNSRHLFCGLSSVTWLQRRWAACPPLLMLILLHSGQSQWVHQQISRMNLGITRWFPVSMLCGDLLPFCGVLKWHNSLLIPNQPILFTIHPSPVVTHP